MGKRQNKHLFSQLGKLILSYYNKFYYMNLAKCYLDFLLLLYEGINLLKENDLGITTLFQFFFIKT